MRKLLRALLTTSLFLTLVAVALPFLVPLDTYRPALQSRLAQITGREVSIESLRLQMLPAPELAARGISVGRHRTGGDRLRVARMRISPDLPSLLFRQAFVIRQIHLSGLEVDQGFIDALIDELPSGNAPAQRPAPVAVERLSGDAVTFRTGDGRVLGPYGFDLVFTGDPRPVRVRIAREDRRLRLQLLRDGDAYLASLRASDWTLPLGPALHFVRLAADGRLADGALRLTRLGSRLYDGEISGTGTLAWQRGWRLTGRIRARDIAMAPIVRVFGGAGVAGRFGGDLALSFTADSPARLLANPMVSGDFTITDGLVAVSGAVRPRFAFERLEAHGVVNRLGLLARDARMTAYGGTIHGEVTTIWSDGWAVAAALAAQSLDSEALLAGFLDRKVLAGRFDGEASVTLAARAFRDLAGNPDVAGTFRFTDGVMYKADLEKASTALSKEGVSGGQTRFKVFSGEAVIHDGAVALDKLRLVSTALAADGRLQIDRERALTGRLEVGVRNTASLISVPILVSGTTTEPRLRPTSSAVIGGMVGTSVLGPGVGTAIGIKVGKLLGAIGAAMRGGEEE